MRRDVSSFVKLPIDMADHDKPRRAAEILGLDPGAASALWLEWPLFCVATTRPGRIVMRRHTERHLQEHFEDRWPSVDYVTMVEAFVELGWLAYGQDPHGRPTLTIVNWNDYEGADLGRQRVDRRLRPVKDSM